MILIPSPVLADLDALKAQVINERKTIISSLEIARIITEAPDQYQHLLTWINGQRNERARKWYFSISLTQAGFLPHNNPRGRNNNRVWKLEDNS